MVLNARIILATIVLALDMVRTAEPKEPPEPPSLMKMGLGAGDVAVRINYWGSLIGYSTWLTIIQHGQLSTADYFVSFSGPGVPRPNSLSPTVSWNAIWQEFSSQDIYHIHDSKTSSCQEKGVVPDAESVDIQVWHGGKLRTIHYYDPMHATCPDGRKLASILAFLQRTFHRQMPFPHPNSVDPPPR